MEEAGEEPMATEDAGGRSFLRKDINHSPHLDRDRLIDSRTMLIVSENEWQYPLSSTRANEDLVDGEEDKAANACAGSHDASVNLVNLNDDNVMVEELTVRNYKGSNSMTIQHSSEGEKLSLGIDQRQWHHYLQIAGGSSDNVIRANDMLKETLNLGCEKAALTICSPTVQRSNSPKSLSGPRDISKTTSTKEDIVAMSKTSSHSSGEMCNKVYSTSGFHHFFSKNSLKGKGTLNTLHGPHVGSRVVTLTQMHEKKACQVDVGSNVSHGFGTRKKHLCKGTDTETRNASPCGDGGRPNVDIISHGGCLREWLASECQKVNKIERLFIFRQILELVAQVHLHGIALKELRPSYFFVMPSKKVRYDGSWSNPIDEMNVAVANQGSFNEEHHVKRKRFLEGSSRSNEGILYKRYKLGGSEMKMNVGHPTFGTSIGLEIGGDIGVNSSFKGLSYGEDQSYDGGFEAENLSSNPNKSSSVPATFGAENLSSNPNKSSFVPATFGSLHMEERWYSSPEELNGGCCTIQSNIYSLGVLFFELFCHFESSEVHARAMSDLRHRILPPSFLSESTNEAGFCLWLLHPDPSSRPKPREILQSEMINEVRHLPSVNELSLAVDEEDSESELLLHFLFALKDQKQKQALKLVGDLGYLREDIKEVERRHSLKVEELGANHASVEYPQKDISSSQMNETRLMRNIRQLEHAYFSMKLQGALSVTDARNRLDKDVLKDDNKLFVHQNDAGGSYTSASTDRIGAFFEGVCKYARFNKFETRGILRNGDFLGSANVICSLSFDRDEDYFAAAGVSKKIKIFEFHSLLNDMVDIHYPIIEMSSKSKLSCVCWNNYIKNYLASTDYDGVVQLWDANTGQGFIQYAEHQKRAWSVDFSRVDPTKLASGSDDFSVKLWSINEKNCLSSIGNVAHVCCVQFSPHSTNLLAFGSADYKINCYDLRNTRSPWCTLAGHGKAVSYVKFIDPVTLISASTDNTLKLWDLNKTTSGGTNACSLTLRGHSNEKNFVGLSVFDGYIACGSESNEVFAYYRSLPMPITSHKFGSIDPISGQEGGDDSGLFVSSVCWRGKSNMVVAANSNGFIKLLQLV